MADYPSTTASGACIFCKIITREIGTPGIFWEDENFMAFLSAWPSVEGFTVVVPKTHHGSDVLAMPDAELQEFILAAKHCSQILLRHFTDAGRVGLIMEGTGVDHAHIKLIPMHGTAHMREGIWKQYLSGRSDYFEKYEGYLISTDGPKADPERLRALAEALRAQKEEE
jgi:diadenosine tetraphosphate (Ap4A) HIT family hydrolase